MSVIIRLQGLPWSASALDIRNFFRGLIIPQGGVHIIGGERGDAFIAFSSDEDARQAMMRNNTPLNGTTVQLFLSSKSEMQNLIDEARNRDSTVVGMSSARMMPHTPNTGVGPDYQSQQRYAGTDDMKSQRYPQQPDYQTAQNPNQATFPGMQQKMGGSQNQVHNQSMPDRANQYNFQDGRYQQSVTTGKQETGNEGQGQWSQSYEGFSADRNLSKDSQQSQWNAGNYGSRMEGAYENSDANQWQKEGADYGTRQPSFGGNPPSQSIGSGHQWDQRHDEYDPSAAGWDKQLPQYQRNEQPQKPDAWQGGMQMGHHADGRGSFTMRTEQAGSQDMNRRGVPGQTSESDTQPRPHSEQWSEANKGQGRFRGYPDEEYVPQSVDENRFPSNREEGFPTRGGPQQGSFPNITQKRGILPTPDMPNQGEQKDYNEQYYNPETTQHGQWQDYSGQESSGYDQGRGQGMFPGGGDSYNKDTVTERRRPFETSETSGPRVRPRRSRFDQTDERPGEKRPDGRPLEGRISGRNLDGKPDGQPVMGQGPDGKSFVGGFSGRPVDDYQSDRSEDRERMLERGPDGQSFRRGRDGQSFEQGDWSHERGPNRRGEGRPIAGESEIRPFDRNSDRSLERNDGKRKTEGLLGRAPENLRPFPGGPDEQTAKEQEGRFNRPHSRFDGPPENRFPPSEEHEPVDMELDNQEHDTPGMSGPFGRGFRGARNFDGHGGDRGYHSGRGRGGMDEGFRGGRGFHRGSDRGRRRGFQPFNQGEEFNQYYTAEEYEDSATEEKQNFGDQFANRHSGRGTFEHGRGGGPGYRGRSMRGHSRPDRDDSRDMDMDRRHIGPRREDMESHRRDRHRETFPDESRGKGLLGDAPIGLLPTPTANKVQEDSHSMQYANDDFHRDRDRRSHRGREERDAGRDDRPSRWSDNRHNRERSPDRERHHRRSDRDRDREHRDRSSHRDRRSDSEKSKSTDKSPEKKSVPSSSSQQHDSKFVYAKGFPTSHTNKEIQQFFSGCDLLLTGIKMVKNAHGRNTGEIYLQFPTVDQAKKAVMKNGEKVFGNEVTLTFTTKQHFEETAISKVSSSNTEKQKVSPSPLPVVGNQKGPIMMIKGLPPNIKREDLTNFFSSVKLASSDKSVVIEYDDKNQATGIAYMVTASPKDFETAMGYDGRILGSKPLQLSAGKQEDIDACLAKLEEIVKRGEQQKPQSSPAAPGPGIMGARPPLMGLAPGVPGPQALYNQKPPMNMPPSARRNGPVFEPNMDSPHRRPVERPPKIHGPGFCVQIQGLPMLATYNDIRDFFRGLDIVNHRGVQIAHDGNGKPSGEGFVEFVSQEDKDEALKKDKTSLGRQIVAVKSIAKPDMIERLRKARLSGVPPPDQGPPNNPRFPPRRAEPLEGSMTIPPRLLNPRWFYISCQNFPAGIAVPDILDFFQDYNPVPDSVRQLYADDGTSTGNAVVGFFNERDATMALEEMNGMLFGQNMVILQPVKGRFD